MLSIKPRVEVDQPLKEKVLTALRVRYEEERAGIHATDLLWPRLAAFRKIHGAKVSEREVVFFTFGSGEGAFIEEVLGGKREVVVIHNGIIHTIDAVLEEGDLMIPVEIKTTRASPPSVKAHYLLQLGMYCTALNTPEGRLIIVYLNDGVIEAYRVKFTDEMIREIGMFEVEKKAEILLALEKKDPLVASCVAGNPDLDWKCVSCQFWRMCSGPTVKFRVEFPEPLMIGRSYEGVLLREALRASEANCTVEIERNEFDEITAVSAEGDVVKLVPLRRIAEEIRDAMEEMRLRRWEKEGGE